MSNMSGFGGPGQPPGGGHPPQPPGGSPPPWGPAPGGQASPGAAPAQPGQGQPGYGHAPQGQMPYPGQANQPHPHPGQAPPGYAPPPYGQPPQGHPHPGYGHAPPGYGHAQPPGYGHAQPGAYPQQPGYPPPQAASQNPFDSIGAPTNAWVPGALVSFFFPGIGLLLIGRPEYKPLAIKIFVGYVALVFGSIIFGILLSFVGLGFLWSILSLAMMAAPIASLIHTHDLTVKAYPHLGAPIFFKN